MTASLSRLSKRTSSKFPIWRLPTKSYSPAILPPDILVEEEQVPGYDAKSFLAVNPGDVFSNRYEATAELGSGGFSTVWPAKDLHWRIWQSDRYVVLKLKTCGYSGSKKAKRESEINQRLAKSNSLHNGSAIIRTTIDSFEVETDHGTHVCLVYEPMREPLWLFQRRFEDGKLPLSLLKAYLKILLVGLDYLHSECHIVHTDLKLNNLLVEFEDPAVLKDFVRAQASNLMPRKIVDVTDPQPKILPIQTDAYRVPEVILGTGWIYSADIWNFGVMIWNLLEKTDLFRHTHSSDGEYSAQLHLAEIYLLLGPPPKCLAERAREWQKWTWSPTVYNSAGQESRNSNEFYRGPFFDVNNNFTRIDRIPSGLGLREKVVSLEGEEKELFLSFAKKMLQWLPENRKTAKELSEDPWLDFSLPEDRRE